MIHFSGCSNTSIIHDDDVKEQWTRQHVVAPLCQPTDSFLLVQSFSARGFFTHLESRKVASNDENLRKAFSSILFLNIGKILGI